MESKWILVGRVGLGVLLAIIAGGIGQYLKASVPNYASSLGIATAVALAIALYIVVFKPLLKHADAQRKAKRRG